MNPVFWKVSNQVWIVVDIFNVRIICFAFWEMAPSITSGKLCNEFLSQAWLLLPNRCFHNSNWKFQMSARISISSFYPPMTKHFTISPLIQTQLALYILFCHFFIYFWLALPHLLLVLARSAVLKLQMEWKLLQQSSPLPPGQLMRSILPIKRDSLMPSSAGMHTLRPPPHLHPLFCFLCVWACLCSAS